ncbi:XAP5-domain-containing protein [Aureobasidium pullulans]|uniref:XAP5-domain-containing protein n=1 Tax=Aureobasidium pullulans TaxID=5580 RepID=A0A4V4IPC1_AURPU|nr:XAP5-domain-containing protein [Aureobasidium pullulans]
MDSEGNSGTSTPNSRFTTQAKTADDILSAQTVGLVQLDDFRKRRADAIDAKEREALESGRATPASATDSSDPTFKPSKKKRKTVKKGALSFGNDEDNDSQTPTESLKSRSSTPAATKEDKINEEDDSPPIKKRLAANSNVGFMAKSMSKLALLREAQTREQLRKDFLVMQEAVKQTDFLLPFVFYDGTNIPGGQCRMKKGDMVWLFLDRARKVGAEVGGSDKARREWARVGVDDLMLVKGDIIIPHHYEFYYFMVNKTIGYNGPLFPHSAEPTANTPLDTSASAPAGGLSIPTAPSKTSKAQMQSPAVPDADLEGFGDDSNSTKVVDRRWYERNKHIFPASTWEDFDPTKDYTNHVRKDVNGNAFFFSS